MAGSVAPRINLAKPGPRIVPRFWSGVLEAVSYAMAEEAASYGKKAEQVALQLPKNMKDSLLFEIARGLRCVRNMGMGVTWGWVQATCR